MPQIDLKKLLGMMDLDSSEENVPVGAHVGARNVIFKGPRGDMRAEVIPGSVEIVNPLLPVTGTNKNIGTFYSGVTKQIFSFNYNSGNISAIYVYDTVALTWGVLIQDGTNTDGVILGFTLDQMITSVGIIYTEVTDGNLLLYVDTLGRPTCLNIQRYLSSTPYTPIKRAFIDLAKAPPVMLPQVTYENDTTATVNNLVNALFQFKTRFVFDDFQKSVYSGSSICPLPTTQFDLIQDTNPVNNSRISIYVPTGDADVKKIEIWAKSYTDGGGESDYFLIISLDKAALSIPDNDVYRFLFKNDSIYLSGVIEEENQLQDFVPQKAGAMELLNGNIPDFGDITEGYDLVNTNMQLPIVQTFPYSRVNGLLFFAAQEGFTSCGFGDLLTIVLTGAGANDVNGNPTQLPGNFNFTKFTVRARNPAGTEIGFTFTAGIGTLFITATLNSLKALAIANGFVFISQGPNTLVMQYPGGYILESSGNTSPQLATGQVTYAYADNDVEQFGIQYFDDKGRTNGTNLSPVSTIKTLTDNTGATTNGITFIINSRPPIWAKYYDIVRAAEIGYAKRTFWISNQTFTDVDLNTGITYAYIGIGYMVDYDQNIQAATPVVKYDFAPGDIVNFQILYDHNSTPTTLASGLSYTIISVAVDPFINGVLQRGNFLKIVDPPAINFGGVDQQWFKILIYSLKKVVQDSTKQTFFEFGYRFGIQNSGTVNACHMGLQQSQTPNLSQPAVIYNQDGDYFYRTRSVPVGYINDLTTSSVRSSFRYQNVPVTINGGDVINAQFELRTVVFTESNTNNQTFGSGNYLFWNKLASPVTIRVQGEYAVVAEQALTHQMMLKISTSTSDTYFFLEKNKAIPLSVGQNTSYSFKFSDYINIPANAQVFIVSYNQSVTAVATMNVGAFDFFRFAIINNITISIIESSFSDNYNIVANSNGRPSEYDINAKQIEYPTLTRWGLADILNTNINQINRFYPQNFDELDKSRGKIVRMKVRDREIRYYQERGCGHAGVFAKFITDNAGNNVLVTTNDIITKNNVEYYVGEYGIANQPASLTSAGFDDYFFDSVRGFAMRLSPSGLDPISAQNRVQTWAGGLTKYLNNYTYQFGGNAQIIGCVWFCNDRPTETLFATQGGTGASGTIPGQIFTFREEGNAWTSFLDINPDNVVCAENNLYYFKNGRMYLVDDKTNYANFDGTQFYPEIELIFNGNIAIKKKFLGLEYQSSGNLWIADTIGDIKTSMINPQTGLQQFSALKDIDFEVDENVTYAAFLFDSNSPVNGILNPVIALRNGDYLNGNWIRVKVTSKSNNFAFLYNPYIAWIPSPRNF